MLVYETVGINEYPLYMFTGAAFWLIGRPHIPGRTGVCSPREKVSAI